MSTEEEILTEVSDVLPYQVFALCMKTEGAIDHFRQHLPIDMMRSYGQGHADFYKAILDFAEKTGAEQAEIVTFKSWLENETLVFDALGGQDGLLAYLEEIGKQELGKPSAITSLMKYRHSRKQQAEAIKELDGLFEDSRVFDEASSQRVDHLVEKIRGLNQGIADPLATIYDGERMAMDAESLWELPDFLPTQFKSLNVALGYDEENGGFIKESVNAVLAASGKGKPLHVDTEISMADGTRKRLGDIEVGDRVITHKSRPRTVVAVHEQGQLPTVRIKTSSGKTVVSALDHSFLTSNGWVEAGDLSKGDTLLSLEGLSHESVKVDVKEARLLGYITGDGSISSGNCSIVCYDDIQGQDIVDCANSLGFDVRIVKNKKQYRLSLGTVGKELNTLIPQPYGITPREREVLSMYCAGWDDERIEGLFEFTSKSSLSTIKSNLVARMGLKMGLGANQSDPVKARIVAKALQEGFGAPEYAEAVIAGQENPRDWLRRHEIYGHTSYEKRVPDKIMGADFEAIVNYIGAYFATDGYVSRPWKGKKRNLSIEFYSVSKQLMLDIQELLDRLGFRANLCRKVGTYKGRPHYSWRLRLNGGLESGERFMNIIPIYGKKRAILEEWPFEYKLPLIPSPGMVEDKIVSIEKHEVVECRCLTVEEDHTFLANGLIVHNSTLVRSFALHWLEIGKKVLYINYEEARPHWERILFTQITRQNIYKAREVSEIDRKHYTQIFKDKMKEWGNRLLVKHDPDTPFYEDMESWVREVAYKHGSPDVLIIDTIQSMFLKSANGLPRWGQYEQMMVRMEKLAKDLHCVIIITAQENSNRMKEKREVVQQSDIGGSLAIAQKSSITLFITEAKLATGDDSQDERIMQLQIPKNRITGTASQMNPPMVRYNDDHKMYEEYVPAPSSGYDSREIEFPEDGGFIG